MDFGLAKLAPASQKVAEGATVSAGLVTADNLLTSPGTAIGTVTYMLPATPPPLSAVMHV
jgi:hypothetical protein